MFLHVRKQISSICIHHIRTEPVTVEIGQSQFEHVQLNIEKCLDIRITVLRSPVLLCTLPETNTREHILDLREQGSISIHSHSVAHHIHFKKTNWIHLLKRK